MKPRSSRRRNWTAANITIAAILALTGCAGPQITSPVGEWVAIEDDHGTLSIRSDGTFTITDASYNPLEDRDADNDFTATGAWRIVRDDAEVLFDFEEASEGNWDVEPSGIAVPFRSGTIRFHDPDDVLDIEFRLVDETPE
ncbi:hypothetical protein [Microbacterium sp. MYb62]|uniref:hypothetical protein n=1 Tax=Microbacterium sp. MYb62 TaxID=1848690 RepID=UPI0011B02281|nr:hypothetical protein [Microbacterium sp. MYb62]